MTTQQEQTHPPSPAREEEEEQEQEQQPAVGSTSFCWKFLLRIFGVLASILDAFVQVVDFAVPAVFSQDCYGIIKKRRERFVSSIAWATIAASVYGLICIIVYLRHVELIELLFDSHPYKSLISIVLYVPGLFTHVIGQMRIEGQGKWLASTFVPVYLIDAVAGLIDTVAGVLPDPESVGMVFIGGALKCFAVQLLLVFVPALVVYYLKEVLVMLVGILALAFLAFVLKSVSLFGGCCLVVFVVVIAGAAFIGCDWDSIVEGRDACVEYAQHKFSPVFMTSREVKLGFAIALSLLALVWKSCYFWVSVFVSVIFIAAVAFIFFKGWDEFLEYTQLKFSSVSSVWNDFSNVWNYFSFCSFLSPISRLGCFLSRKDMISSEDDAANKPTDG